jgi:hypothetical protein
MCPDVKGTFKKDGPNGKPTEHNLSGSGFRVQGLGFRV